jgi:hypothetical protein
MARAKRELTRPEAANTERASTLACCRRAMLQTGAGDYGQIKKPAADSNLI